MTAEVFAETPSDDLGPVLSWLLSEKTGGRLVIGGKLAEEVEANGGARRAIRRLEQAGRARRFPETIVRDEETRVRELGLCRSDDHHVIALARVSGARMLCSRDRNLHQDFKNLKLVPGVKGKIYQCADHVGLLKKKDTCPPW